MKMQLKKQNIPLIIIFLAITLFRIYIALSMNNFSSDEAYYNLRIINHIISEKSIFTYDTLSYGGKDVTQPQLFHVILAILTFGNIILLKIIPEIFMGLAIFVVYLIAKELSKNNITALISALFSGLVPILFIDTLNVISAYTLAIPILLFMIYSLLKLENTKYRWAFLICALILPLTHPIALMFVIIMIFYFILLGGGLLHATKLKKEAVITGTLFILLLLFIQYKKAFIQYGIGVIWQNAPANIIADSFKKVTAIDLVFGIGLVPLILGAIGVYIGITKEKSKLAYLFSSLILAISSLLVFRLITLSLGLLLLGLGFSILSAITLDRLITYSKKIKVSFLGGTLIPTIFILFLFTSFFPIFAQVQTLKDINNEKIKDMEFIKNELSQGAVVLTNLKEGNIVTALAGKKSVIDTNFMLAPNPIERLKDADTIYSTVTGSVASELLKKYNISMVYFSDETKKLYNLDRIAYADDNPCIKYLGEDFYVIKC